MRKSLLIGLILVVLALGAMGAAFATSMTLPGVGFLAAGHADIPQVDVDGVTWWVNNNYAPDYYVDTVSLSFTRSLAAGTEIGIAVTDSAGDPLANLWYRLAADLPADESVALKFYSGGGPGLAPLHGAIALLGVDVEQVYDIAVAVSAETIP